MNTEKLDQHCPHCRRVTTHRVITARFTKTTTCLGCFRGRTERTTLRGTPAQSGGGRPRRE
jgi:hypothetical protein